MKTHEDYLKYCYDIANRNSPDPSTRNCSIIVENPFGNYPIYYGMGSNAPVDGLIWNDDQIADRTWKYKHIIHAEVDACLQMGTPPMGANPIMYCTWACCFDCAKVIVHSGVKKVISHVHPAQSTHQNWIDSVNEGLKFLKDCGIEHVPIDTKLGVTTRFNYEDIEV